MRLLVYSLLIFFLIADCAYSLKRSVQRRLSVIPNPQGTTRQIPDLTPSVEYSMGPDNEVANKPNVATFTNSNPAPAKYQQNQPLVFEQKKFVAPKTSNFVSENNSAFSTSTAKLPKGNNKSKPPSKSFIEKFRLDQP